MHRRTEQEIMQNWKGGLDEPLVSICCATYNHEEYIAEAIDGFLMQETDFPYEVLIRDDCSTDKTAEIVKHYAPNYPKLIKTVLEKENKYSKGIKPGSVLYKRAIGKYIAICEGDDYWIDPKKLEKQVGFLEDNPKYVLCWTRFKTLDEKSGEQCLDNNSDYFSKKKGIDFDFGVFAKGWHIGMQTFVFKREILIENNHFKNKYYRDIFMISDLLAMGKGYCLNEVTAIYRIHAGGIYSSTNEMLRAENGSLIYREIYQTYNDNKYLRAKYKKFNNYYIRCLIKNKLYKKALFVLDERITIIAKSLEYKDDLFGYINEKLLQKKLYIRIKIDASYVFIIHLYKV